MLPAIGTRDDAVPILVPPQLTGLLLGGSGGGAHFVHAPARRGRAPPRQQQSQPQQAQQPRARAPGRVAPTAAGRAPGGDARAGGGRGWLRGGVPALPTTWRRVLRGAGLGAGLAAGGGLFCEPANALQLWPFSRRKGAPRDGSMTVLIMMSNTGGGHKASAEALQQAFREEYGDKFRVVIVDMWKQHTPPPFNNLCDSYSFLVRHGFLWRATYGLLQPRAVHMPYFSAVHAFVGQSLLAAFDAVDPDLVVSVHPLMQHIPARVLAARAARDGRPPPPFATVVTDFTTCHNTWFFPAVSRCFVPTAFAAGLARGMGVAPGAITVHGLPIRPIFSKRLPSKGALRAKLGLRGGGAPVVLLVGGGEGMGALAETVERLDARLGSGVQVAVICGRNRKLLAALRAAPRPGGAHVVAVGFVDNVHEWMAAADVIVTKAGPGTIAEALISGLPILLNGNVPCQEEGNIPYVVDNGVGAFETDPDAIAAILAGWLAPANAAAFAEMGRRARALGRPRAVYNIVRDLAALAEEGAAARAAAGAGAKARCGGGGGGGGRAAAGLAGA